MKDLRSDERRAQPFSLMVKDILSASVTNSPLGLIIWEIKGDKTRILEWNRAAERIFGWSRTEIIGRDLLKYLLVDDDIYVFRQIMDLFQTSNSPHNYQNECLVKDGNNVIINWFNTPINDKRRNRLFVLSLIEDISERNQAQEALRTTNQSYQALIQGSPLAIIILDEKWCINLWNPAAEKIFGWNEKDVLKKKLPMLIDSQRDSLKKHLKQVYQGKSLSGIELKVLNRDRKELDIDISMAPLTNVEESINGAIMLATDITDKADALTTLTKFETKNKALLKAIPDPILLIDQSGDVIDSFPSSIPELNKQLAGMIGRNLKESLPPEMQSVFFEKIKQIESDAQGERFNFSLSTDEDAPVYEARLVAYGKKEVLAVIRDITDEKHQQEIVKDLADKKQSNQEKTLFLSNLSYEILTPLNTILGFVDVLDQQLSEKSDANQKELLESISQNSQQLLRTIQELSDLTAIDTNKFKLSPEFFRLDELVLEILKPYRSQIKDKNLKLKTDISDIDFTVRADKYTITEAVSHFIDNAVKYTNKGKIEIKLSARVDQIVCSIIDTGMGMSRAQTGDLFKLFAQVGNGYQRKYRGMGLGMVLAKRLLDMNDVDLQVHSARHKGSEFSLTFDTSRVKDSDYILLDSVDQPKPAKRPAKPKPLILIVEDDASSQRLIQYLLKNEYGMCFAISVNKAKDQLSKKPVDIIIIDLSLKGKEDGLDLVEYIRKQKKYKQVPIIATTAHTSVLDRDKCLTAGCNEFLTKPLSKQLLFEALERVI